MIGAEDSGGTRVAKPQYHMATIHWLANARDVGWIRLRHNEPFNGTARPGSLLLWRTRQDGREVAFSFEVSAPSIELPAITEERWCLPGLTVLVATDAHLVEVTQQDERAELRYAASVGERALSVELSVALESRHGLTMFRSREET